MSTEVAVIRTLQKKMRDVGDGGGDANDGVQNERKFRKRKSEEPLPVGTGCTKKARKWKHRFKTKRSKFPKKPRSVDGDAPKRKKIVRRRRMTESFNAPFNSTQFIMNDHVDDAVKHLNSTLNVKQKVVKNTGEESESDIDYAMERPMRRITRARESSFSIDSDEDYYYSSPEDEEEFMSKEFIKDYDSVRNDRLIDMSKDELINEYLQMEQRIEALEKRLSNKSQEEASPKPVEEPDETISDTIKHFQKEIHRLKSENSQLKQVQSSNSASCSNSCSSSSSSESSDSSCSSSEGESDQEEEVIEAQINPDAKAKRGKIQKIFEVQDVDTGYESGQSNKKSAIDPNEEKEVVVNNEDIEQKDLAENCSDSISVNCITSTSQS